MATLSKHLIGRLCKLREAGRSVESLNLMDDREIVCITTDDLDKKTINFFDKEIPVFYQDRIEHLGQVGFAVFGPDFESVEDYLQQTEVSYGPREITEPSVVATYSFTEGRISSYFKKTAQTIDSQFVFEKHASRPLNDLRVKAWESGGKYHIETATQWPLQLRKSVAEQLGLELKNVVLHSMPYHDIFDEYLFAPIQASVIAAVAAKKTDCVCELVVTPVSWQPEIKINISSVQNKAKNCCAMKVDATVDMGAFPILEEEYLKSLTAGLIPVYKLNAVEINTRVIRSQNPNACFYSDLGYSIGLAAIENHFNKVAKKLDIHPTMWRQQNIFKSTISGYARKSAQFSALKRTFEDCTEKSRFDRYYSIYSQESFTKNGVNTFLQYSRGIGIACGEGTQGFSSEYKNLKQYSLKTTLEKDDQVAIACGIIPDSFLAGILKNIVQNTLKIEDAEIRYENSEDETDFGPSVLSRKIKYTPVFTEKCCKVLARRKSRPTSITLSQGDEKAGSLYESDSFGTLALALHIEPVRLIPIVDNIWINLKFGKIWDKNKVVRMIRQTVASTLSEICPCAEHCFDLDITIEDNDNFTAGSATNLMRGLTIAAFTSALSQALGHTIKKMPVDSSDVLGIEAKHEN